MTNIRAEIEKYDRAGGLSQLEPEYILDLVQRAFSGELNLDELEDYHQFWYSIATSAAMMAFASKRASDQVDFAWAKLANTTYQLLSTLAGQDNMIWSWMLFKVKLINSVGRELDPALASSAELTNWFFDNLTFSIEEAGTLISRMQTGIPVDVHIQHEFLKIRERAKTVNYLRQGEAFQMSPELEAWIKLFNFKKAK